jgi:hypothetical protein
MPDLDELQLAQRRASNISNSLDLGPGYEPLTHVMMAIMAEQCGTSQERDRFFVPFFRPSASDHYSRLVTEATLDGLRVSEGIRQIISKAQDYSLVTRAIDVEWLREDPEQLEPIWSERFEMGRATSPEEAVDFLTYVEFRWQTDAGRAAVEIIEEAIADHDPLPRYTIRQFDNLADKKLHHLSILGALSDYDLSRVVPQVQTWSESLRRAILRRHPEQEFDEDVEQRILELLKESEISAPDP